MISLVSDVGRYHKHQRDFPANLIETMDMQEKEDLDEALIAFEERRESEGNEEESERDQDEVTVPNKGTCLDTCAFLNV